MEETVTVPVTPGGTSTAQVGMTVMSSVVLTQLRIQFAVCWSRTHSLSHTHTYTHSHAPQGLEEHAQGFASKTAIIIGAAVAGSAVVGGFLGVIIACMRVRRERSAAAYAVHEPAASSAVPAAAGAMPAPPGVWNDSKNRFLVPASAPPQGPPPPAQPARPQPAEGVAIGIPVQAVQVQVDVPAVAPR